MDGHQEKMNREGGFKGNSKRGILNSKTKKVKGKSTASVGPSASHVLAEGTAKKTKGKQPAIKQDAEEVLDDENHDEEPSDEYSDAPNTIRPPHPNDFHEDLTMVPDLDNGEGPSNRKLPKRRPVTPRKKRPATRPRLQEPQEEHGGEDDSDEEVHRPKKRSKKMSTNSTPPNIPPEQPSLSTGNRTSKRLREREEQEEQKSEEESNASATPTLGSVQTPKNFQKAKKEGFLENRFWEVKKIHDHRWRKKNGKWVFEYLIEWKGKEHKGKDSWEEEATKIATDEYWKENGEKKPRKPKG